MKKEWDPDTPLLWRSAKRSEIALYSAFTQQDQQDRLHSQENWHPSSKQFLLGITDRHHRKSSMDVPTISRKKILLYNTVQYTQSLYTSYLIRPPIWRQHISSGKKVSSRHRHRPKARPFFALWTHGFPHKPPKKRLICKDKNVSWLQDVTRWFDLGHFQSLDYSFPASSVLSIRRPFEEWSSQCASLSLTLTPTAVFESWFTHGFNMLYP